MAARAFWKGYLKLSLVSCPVRLYRATSQREHVSFHLINPKTHNRVQMRPVDAATGKELARDALIKGYEVAKGRYVEIDPKELEALKSAASNTIELARFVAAAAVDPVYFDEFYYLAPDGKMAAETYRVLREAMRREGLAAIGHIVLTTREHPAMLTPHDRGILLTTLRDAKEVRADAPLFAAGAGGKAEEELVAMAVSLMKQRRGKFDAKTLTDDRHQDALRALVARKAGGKKPPAAKSAPRGSNVIDLMEALRRSVKEKPGKSAAAEKPDRRPPTAGGKKPARKTSRAAHRTAS